MVDIIHRSVIPLVPEPVSDSDTDSESESSEEEEPQQPPLRRARFRPQDMMDRQRRIEARAARQERRVELARSGGDEPSTEQGVGGRGTTEGAIEEGRNGEPGRRQSSWHFVLPFGSESNEWAGTLRMQVRDMVRRKYDEVLGEEVLGRMSFEYAHQL